MSKLKLNIGGVRYETTTLTLSRYPESVLARLIQQPNEADLIKNEKELFIDRDGQNFRHVLNYLRHGDQAVLPTEDATARQSILQEADFYQLPGLVRLVKRGGAFEVGDLVQIRDSTGITHLEKVLASEKLRDTLCSVCEKPMQIQQYVGLLRPKSSPEWDKVLGKIHEINEDCAAVGFAYSSLLFAYDRLQTWEEAEEERLDYECMSAIYGDDYAPEKEKDFVVSMHVPLRCLKLKN